jgi:hypothetical protein
MHSTGFQVSIEIGHLFYFVLHACTRHEVGSEVCSYGSNTSMGTVFSTKYTFWTLVNTSYAKIKTKSLSIFFTFETRVPGMYICGMGTVVGDAKKIMAICFRKLVANPGT